MDLVVGVQGVEVLRLVEVPEHGGAVLATRGAEGAVGGDGDGVDVAGVADVVGLELAGGELPNLVGTESVSNDFMSFKRLFPLPRTRGAARPMSRMLEKSEFGVLVS